MAEKNLRKNRESLSDVIYWKEYKVELGEEEQFIVFITPPKKSA